MAGISGALVEPPLIFVDRPLARSASRHELADKRRCEAGRLWAWRGVDEALRMAWRTATLRRFHRSLAAAMALIMAFGLFGAPPLHAQDVDEDGMPVSQPAEPSAPPQEPEAQPQDQPQETMPEDNPGEAAPQAEEGQPAAEPETPWFSSGGPTAPGAGDAGDKPLAAGTNGSAAPIMPGQAGPDPGMPRRPGEASRDQSLAFGASPEILGLILAAVAALAAALLAAKLLMPWPRPRLRCAGHVAPPSLQGGTLALHPPDLSVSAESVCGTPSLAGEVIIEQGDVRDA